MTCDQSPSTPAGIDCASSIALGIIDRFSFLPFKGRLPEQDDDKEEVERSFWLSFLSLFLFLLHENDEGEVVIIVFAFLRLHLRRRLFLASFVPTRTVGVVEPRKEDECDMTDKQDQLDYLFLVRRAHKFFPLSLSLLLFFFFFSMKKAARGCLDCYRIRADALSQISLRIGLLLSPGSERRKRISLDRFEVLRRRKRREEKQQTLFLHFYNKNLNNNLSRAASARGRYITIIISS